MPNIKSAKKRVLVTKKSTILNNDIKANTRDRYKTRLNKLVNEK